MIKPLIYIASIQRTGSTLLAELLSSPPLSFVFREPGFSRDFFNLKLPEFYDILKYGINLRSFQKEFQDCLPEDRLGFVNESISNGLLSSFLQIGIKEIYHEKWERLYSFFPDMKIIITARNPKDIYISSYYMEKRRQKRGKNTFKMKFGVPFSPKNLARYLLYEFNHQLAMYNQVPCHKVKYETLCTQPEITLEKIKQFVDYPDVPWGKSGIYSAYNDKVHRDQITTKKVNRWKTESNIKLLEDAHIFFHIMMPYCKFWEYFE